MGEEVALEHAFDLLRLGVAACFAPAAVAASVDGLLAAAVPADLALLARRDVGRTPLPALFDELRREMHAEALARCDGNVARASALLGLSRRAMQKALRGRAARPEERPSASCRELAPRVSTDVA